MKYVSRILVDVRVCILFYFGFPCLLCIFALIMQRIRLESNCRQNETKQEYEKVGKPKATNETKQKQKQQQQ